MIQAYDDATVILLRATSSAAALIMADADERMGIPAYDDTPGIDPRQHLFVCVARGCGRRFWSSPEHHGGLHVCSRACLMRWRLDNIPRVRELQRRWQARRRAALKVA